MKTVLIVTYYWPPAGGPGVQRWLKFVTYFEEFGIKPIVYIPENPNYPIVDSQFENQIPAGATVIKHPINEPYRFAKLFSKKKTKSISSGIITKEKPSLFESIMLYVRGNFFIPDARIGWVKPSVKFLKAYLKSNPVDAMITTGPPHSLHLIGKKINEQINVPWIADFRDPWTTIHYHQSLRLTKKSQEKHKKLEKLVLDSADAIVVTSPTTKQEFKALTKTPIKVITNGYDEATLPEVTLDSKFSIAHIGSLLTERNPLTLWEVISEIATEDSRFRQDLKLVFAGAVSDEVKKSLERNNLLSNAEFLGYISHQEALVLQRKSQLLLLLEMDRPETRAIIPGKLFEYLAAKRPILAVGPEGSDIEGILEQTQSGSFFSPAQKDVLKRKIEQLYRDFKTGKLGVTSQGIENYSRRNLTEEMANFIRDTIA